MSMGRASCIACIVLAALGNVSAFSQAKPQPLLAEDRGTLDILRDGQSVGTEVYRITADEQGWIARGETELRGEEGRAKVQGELRLKADGSPERYEWSSTGQKKSSAIIRFEGTTALMELRMEGAPPFSQDFLFAAPPVVVLDNNLYHQYAILAALYDWKRGGVQTFSVLVPQSLTPGTITAETFRPSEGNSTGKIHGLRVRSADLEIEVYVDESRRLVRLSVPSANAEIIKR